MAHVRKLSLTILERVDKHTDVDATYTIVEDQHGNRCLQIDTYGSKGRKFKDKKSQSLRFSGAVLRQLRDILNNEF